MLKLQDILRRSRLGSLRGRNAFAASRKPALIAENSSNVKSETAIDLAEADTVFDACKVLSESDVPCYIWGEHALAYHGVPTFVWDVFLLVEEPEVAEKILLAWGLVRTKPNPRFSRNILIQQAPRLAVPIPHTDSAGTASQSTDHGLPTADDQSNPGWVLLRASDWPNNMLASKSKSYIPSVSTFFNCLVSTYMETFDFEDRSRIAGHISYLYSYVDEVKTDEFIEKVLLENRQFHFDRLTRNHDRKHIIFEKVLIANRAIRERIRRGEHVPTKDGNVADIPETRALYGIHEAGEQR